MIAAVVVLVLAVADVGWRRAPNWLTLPLIGLGLAVNGRWYALSVLGIGAFTWLAGFPGGDVKGASAMAAWVPPAIMVWGFIGTLVVTLMAMQLTRHPRYAYLADEPWLALLAFGLGYATLLQIATGGGGS